MALILPKSNKVICGTFIPLNEDESVHIEARFTQSIHGSVNFFVLANQKNEQTQTTVFSTLAQYKTNDR